MKLRMILLVLTLATTVLSATPAQVILIRHGEKPKTGNTLSQKGYERADALISFFTEAPSSAPYSSPVAIYAQNVSKNHQSERPIETVTPLATTLGITINHDYTYADYDTMVDEIMGNSNYDNKTVLICWSRQKIGDIASRLGVSPAPTYPKGVYDRLWLVNFSADGKSSNFQNLSQRLLFHDSKA